MNERIFVIEDDENIQEIVKLSLESNGYQVTLFDNAIDAIVAIHDETPDLAIFDVMLPQMDGITAVKKIRETNHYMPILILSAKDSEIDKIHGLDSGSDDYMTKPFRIKELYARLQALLRRTQSWQEKILVGDLQIDLERREVFMNKQEIHLSAIDFDILKMLMVHKNQVLTRQQLLEAIDQENDFVEDNTLSVHVKRLRDKLGTYHGHSYIETVRGIGYRLNKEVLYEDE